MEAPHRDIVDWLTPDLILITVILIPIIIISKTWGVGKLQE
jgi:hypothetical protein